MKFRLLKDIEGYIEGDMEIWRYGDIVKEQKSEKEKRKRKKKSEGN